MLGTILSHHDLLLFPGLWFTEKAAIAKILKRYTPQGHT